MGMSHIHDILQQERTTASTGYPYETLKILSDKCDLYMEKSSVAYILKNKNSNFYGTCL
jgi:hypothetical protein